MRKLFTIIATVAIALAAAVGLTACAAGYSPATVVGETYCPNNPFYICLVMSNGDILGPVQPSVLTTIVTGMSIDPARGRYNFYRPAGCTCSRITSVAASSAYSGHPVYKTPKAEASAEQFKSDYNDVQKAKRASASASAQAVKASRSAAKASQAARYASQRAEPQDHIPAGYKGSTVKPAKVPAYKAPAKIGK
jgi:hypothetical protein